MTLTSIDQYGTGFQIKVISALLTKKEFLVNIHDLLAEDYFSNQGHKWIIKQILDYYYKYHTTPSMEVLKVELKKLNNEVLQISIKEQLKEAYSSASSDDLEYVEKEFSNFCRNQQLKKALLNSVDLLNAGDYDSIRILVNNALKAGQEKNLGHEYNKDTESTYREDNRSFVPTPWDHLNVLLQGGLGSGDLGIIFGNPGGGKSWTLISLGGVAAKLGYNVLHYTLELGEDYVGRRYDAFFTNISVNNITKHRDKVDEIVPKLPGNLIIKEFPMGKATVATIESHIKQCIELDFKPDLVIIDYIDLLRSKRLKGERKDEVDDLYVGVKGLARELKLPIWSVSQVNRAGAKDDIIEGDKAAGSYDKIMIADFAMSLSRKRLDKTSGTGRFHIMKNRYGMDGMTFSAKIDTSTGHIDIDTSELQITDEEASYQPSKGLQPNANFDVMDKKLLSQKFFELGK